MSETTTLELCDYSTPALSSVSELVGAVASVKREDHSKLWFRGHDNDRPQCGRDEYQLVPSAGRPHWYAGRRIAYFTPDQERAMLHRFRRRAYLFQGQVLSWWEALFLARHHGLPTRLLDWTANPLFALYFACMGGVSHGGTVWAIRRCADGATLPDVLTDIGRGPPTSLAPPTAWYAAVDAIKLIYPIYNSPRLVNQDGVFTLHTRPQVPLEQYAGRTLPFGSLDVRTLLKWRVASRAKPAILRDLDNLGVNRRTIFPDLDGLAESLWAAEVMWNGQESSDEAAPD